MFYINLYAWNVKVLDLDNFRVGLDSECHLEAYFIAVSIICEMLEGKKHKKQCQNWRRRAIVVEYHIMVWIEWLKVV